MGFLRSNKLQIGLFCLVLIQFFFLTNHYQEKIRVAIPKDKYSAVNLPGNFVSILSFHYLFTLNKGSLQQMTINNTYKGIITKIHSKPGVYIGFLYEKAIEIEENNEKNMVPIAKSALQDLLVSDLNGSSIRLEDLKVGDEVEIIEILDFTQIHPLADQKITIYKLSQ